jgi:hypothetical protein
MHKINFIFATLFVIGLLSSCDNSKPTPPAPTVSSVTVTSTSAILDAAATTTLSASVVGTNGFDAGVNWSIVSGSGTVSAFTGASITFTAPSLNSASTTLIRATSVQDPSKSGDLTLNIKALTTPPVPTGDFQFVSITPTNFVLHANSTQTIDVQLERLNGFIEQITLTANSLPDGVTIAPMILQGNESKVKLEITALKTTTANSQFTAILSAVSKSITRLQEYKFNVEKFVTPVLNISLPYKVISGEEITFTAKTQWEYSKHSFDWQVFDGITLITLIEVSRQDVVNFDPTTGSYSSSVTYKAPAIFRELRAQASIKTVPEVTSSLNFLPQHKISQINYWSMIRLAVTPLCVQRDSSSSCGTDLSAYTNEAKATGQVVPLDARSIALPAVGVPVPSQIGKVNTGVTWAVTYGPGEVKQVNGNWYYTVAYPSVIPSTLNKSQTVIITATSLEEPDVTASSQFDVGFFTMTEPDGFDPPFVQWTTEDVPDTTAIQLAMHGYNKIFGQTFTLVWSVTSTQGNAGSISQRGCYQPPVLATGAARDVTVKVSVAEVPAVVFEKVIHVRQGATYQSGGCNGSIPDANGWI